MGSIIKRIGLSESAKDHSLNRLRTIYRPKNGMRPRAGQATRAFGERSSLEKDSAQVALDLIADAVLVADLQGKVSYMNVMAEKLTGWSRHEALNQPVEKVFRTIDAATRKPVAFSGQRAIRHDIKVELAANSLLVSRDGRETAIEDSAAPVHNRAGEVTGAVVVFHDLMFSKTTAARMAHLAQHDWLTGLPNRAALNDRLTQALALARRHAKQVGVLFIDLDNFKQINDTLGHARGDQLLIALSRRLVDCVRETDTVSRYGGDEFVVLLSEIERPEHASQVARKLREAVSVAQLLDSQTPPLGVSVGISIYPDHGGDVETLLKNADRSMYKAKARKALGALRTL